MRKYKKFVHIYEILSPEEPALIFIARISEQNFDSGVKLLFHAQTINGITQNAKTQSHALLTYIMVAWRRGAVIEAYFIYLFDLVVFVALYCDIGLFRLDCNYMTMSI